MISWMGKSEFAAACEQNDEVLSSMWLFEIFQGPG